MNLSKNIITGIVLIGAGSYKTYKDYKSVSDEQKKRTLIRNITVLGVAAGTAIYTNSAFVNRINKNNRLQTKIKEISQNFIKKIVSKKNKNKINFNKFAEFTTNCIKDISVASISAITGIYSGKLTDIILKKFPQIEDNNQYKTYEYIDKSFSKVVNNPYVDKYANEKNKNIVLSATRVFNAAGFISNPFEMPNIIMNSYDMAKRKNVKQVLEKTATGIFIGALIPTLLLAIGNSLIKTKNIFVKIPMLALTFWTGDKIGEKITNKLKQIHVQKVSKK